MSSSPAPTDRHDEVAAQDQHSDPFAKGGDRHSDGTMLSSMNARVWMQWLSVGRFWRQGRL